MKKKVLALLLIGTMTMSLTGCMHVISQLQSKSTEENVTNSTSVTESAIVNEPATEATTQEIINTENSESTENIDVVNTEETTQSTEEVNSNDSKFSSIDTETGKTLFRLVNYDYDTAYLNGVDKANVIYSFVEPEGWKVDMEYVKDTIGYADTLFFLVNDDHDSISLECQVPPGIVYYYEKDSAMADAEKALNYTLVEMNHKTPYNSTYGYDIFKYNYEIGDDSAGYFYTVVFYVTDDSSFVMELPDSSIFDTIEEVTEFIDTNF